MRDHPELTELGVDLVGVAQREAYQAAHLMNDGIGVPLLIDPAGELRRSFDIDEHFGWRGVVNPKGLRAYIDGWRRQRDRSDPLWSETRVRPALVLLDTDDNVLWSRVGKYLGDYPSADEAVAELQRALR